MKLDDSLGYLLNVAARVMKQQLDTSLKDYDISTSQWAVLEILSEYEELTQVEIARLLHSDKATCGAILEKLKRKNLIMKELHKNDKRAYIIKLTPCAKDIMGDISQEAISCNKRIEEKFDKTQIADIKRVLAKIITIGE